MKTKQSGFTLIELMIVIAVMGILIAIALPVYQNYTARSQSVEGLKAISGVQADVSIYYFENDAMPPLGSDVLSFASRVDGKYFDAGDVSVIPGTGVINVAFRYGVNQGSMLTLTPDISVGSKQVAGWSCGGLSSKRLPSTCQ